MLEFILKIKYRRFLLILIAYAELPKYILVEADLNNQADNMDSAVDDWLKQLPEDKRKMVLGIQGNKEWLAGDGWKIT